MVPVEPLYMGLFQDLVLFVPALALNPFTAVPNAILGGTLLAAIGIGG